MKLKPSFLDFKQTDNFIFPKIELVYSCCWQVWYNGGTVYYFAILGTWGGWNGGWWWMWREVVEAGFLSRWAVTNKLPLWLESWDEDWWFENPKQLTYLCYLQPNYVRDLGTIQYIFCVTLMPCEFVRWTSSSINIWISQQQKTSWPYNLLIIHKAFIMSSR